MAEAARLKWSNVLLADGGDFIRISAEAAKTLRCRLIPVPDGLANYLKVVRKDDGYVYAAAKAAWMFFRSSRLPSRGLWYGWYGIAQRASGFCPLVPALALTKDAAATAFEMGNLMRDYRELTTPAVGQEWFAIRP